MPLNLPYYYGHSGEQYAFFRIPKLLLTDDRFAEISTDAKLLYGLLLDRMELSYRNGWIDEQNRVFIIFTAEEVMSTLRCRSEKAARLFSELDSAKGIGLIRQFGETVILIFLLIKSILCLLAHKQIVSSVG